MTIVLYNALLVDIDPPNVQAGELRIENGRIAERGETVSHALTGDEVDCAGAVVLPGLVNGHSHLYSALAVGMPPPPQPPQNFLEILKFIWWRLDRALDADSIEMSARIGALDALHCGTTTLIDHHASPNCIAGSLDLVEKGIADVGLRGVLCYETTDRNGIDGGEAGLEENRRYLERRQLHPSTRFAGLVGAHASFTLEDETLRELARLAADFGTGVHVHVAEDPCDEDACAGEHQTFLIDRLANYGLLQPESVFAHGTHLNPEAIARISRAGLTIAHSPRSNMNNAVGYAPIGLFRCPIMLGTDGIGSDMFAEAEHAWFKSRDAEAGITPNDVLALLANSAGRASQALGVTLGRLEPGAAADVVIADYCPATPLTSENLAGHFLFALGSKHVRSVIANGTWALRDRTVTTRDEAHDRHRAARAAKALWKRMETLEAT